MIQEIAVIVIFIGALAYLGRILYRQFQAKSACATGCAKCGAVDFKKIEEHIHQKGLL